MTDDDRCRGPGMLVRSEEIGSWTRGSGGQWLHRWTSMAGVMTICMGKAPQRFRASGKAVRAAYLCACSEQSGLMYSCNLPDKVL